jgi:hypothetical protein
VICHIPHNTAAGWWASTSTLLASSRW